MTLLSKPLEPFNFESYNSLKLSSDNIQRLCYNFVGCESLIETNLPVILASCETNLEDSNESSNFYVKGYLLSIRKDFVTHIYGLANYVQEGVSFAQELSLENSENSYFCFFSLLSKLLLISLSIAILFSVESC